MSGLLVHHFLHRSYLKVLACSLSGFLTSSIFGRGEISFVDPASFRKNALRPSAFALRPTGKPRSKTAGEAVEAISFWQQFRYLTASNVTTWIRSCISYPCSSATSSITLNKKYNNSRTLYLKVKQQRKLHSKFPSPDLSILYFPAFFHRAILSA